MLGEEKSCCVPGCSSGSKNSSGVNLYPFPEDEELREKWGTICRFDEWKNESALVCSTHFADDDFEPDLQAVLTDTKPDHILKKNVVPSLNIPVKEEPVEKTTRGKRRKNSSEETKEEESKSEEENLEPNDEDDPPWRANTARKSTGGRRRPRRSTRFQARKRKKVTKSAKEDKTEDNEEVVEDETVAKDKTGAEVKKPSEESGREGEVSTTTGPEGSHSNPQASIINLLVMPGQAGLYDISYYQRLLQEKDKLCDHLSLQIVRLKRELTDTRTNLGRQVTILKNLTKVNALVNARVKRILSKLFTPTQVKVLLHNKKRPNWTMDEIVMGNTLRKISKRAYVYITKTLNYPLPGLSTIQRWSHRARKEEEAGCKERGIVSAKGSGEESLSEGESAESDDSDNDEAGKLSFLKEGHGMEEELNLLDEELLQEESQLERELKGVDIELPFSDDDELSDLEAEIIEDPDLVDDDDDLILEEDKGLDGLEEEDDNVEDDEEELGDEVDEGDEELRSHSFTLAQDGEQVDAELLALERQALQGI